MNFQTAITAPKPRLLLIVTALVAAIALSSIAMAGQATARSAGGVAVSGGGVAVSGGSDSPGDGPPGAVASAASAKYNRLYTRIAAREKRWARTTSECESGGDPGALSAGGTYRGAFQFLRSTWRVSPMSPGGDPITYSYRTQAVVAVALKKRDGAGHWPVCG